MPFYSFKAYFMVRFENALKSKAPTFRIVLVGVKGRELG